MLFSEIVPTALSIQSTVGITFLSIVFTLLIFLVTATILRILIIKIATNKPFKEVFGAIYGKKVDFLTYSLFMVLVTTIILVMVLYIIPILCVFGYWLFECIRDLLMFWKQ